MPLLGAPQEVAEETRFRQAEIASRSLLDLPAIAALHHVSREIKYGLFVLCSKSRYHTRQAEEAKTFLIIKLVDLGCVTGSKNFLACDFRERGFF